MTGADPVVADLRRDLFAALAACRLGGRRIALLDFPNYSNVGDSAIWLGQRAVLDALGARVVYACHIGAYSRPALARRLGDGCICLSGGGNFGDLYPHHQAFRERVVADFPDHEVVQLPQTICYREPDGLARTRQVLARHPRFTLLVRDRASLDLAQGELGVAARLAADMAFGLPDVGRRARPEGAVVGLCRTDFEGSGALAPLGDLGARVVDWIDEEPSPAQRGLEAIEHAAIRHPRLLGWARTTAARLYDSIARERLRRGLSLLDGASAVVTDRLHGHILSLLAGIPHAIVDTRFGKVRAFHETWTARSPLVRLVDSAEGALAAVAALRERGGADAA